MCLAVPARILQLIAPDLALCEMGAIQKEISVALLEEVQIGDYVLVHVGFALSRLDPEEAQETLALFSELESFDE
jgi:hydrogenase expression/formation protein HypC